MDIKERTNIFTNCSLFFAPCLSALLISCCEYFLITVKLRFPGVIILRGLSSGKVLTSTCIDLNAVTLVNE